MAMDVQTTKGKKGQAHPEMNVTPLVDVVLVLLIIFMVVTPLLHAHFWVHVPKNDKQEEVEAPPSDPGEGPIVVSVNDKGHIQINRDVYPDADFPVRLRRMLVARGERKVFFDAHDDAPYARAVEVLDLARGAGAAHIAVTTEGLR
ncbi:MAG: biopolymer transporter ExbD [Myxococcales bacterium]|jgi:biopolymer transport protein TolR|nr:biopolymer transporter ExbD [Myxococcales bacterium]